MGEPGSLGIGRISLIGLIWLISLMGRMGLMRRGWLGPLSFSFPLP